MHICLAYNTCIIVVITGHRIPIILITTHLIVTIMMSTGRSLKSKHNKQVSFAGNYGNNTSKDTFRNNHTPCHKQ